MQSFHKILCFAKNQTLANFPFSTEKNENGSRDSSEYAEASTNVLLPCTLPSYRMHTLFQAFTICGDSIKSAAARLERQTQSLSIITGTAMTMTLATVQNIK